ncbi:hypothetical protein Dsin_029767 [Dipteronia sinensis]|uniref:Importin N-terminal domain-containing protein n=1 Tax=Dipteronia sinensis TaxID=43782 RepID=A0AAD9ZUP0_9ROSI|nr:hypothetical protein Dsin_029767 [Dipteronia sinensis]
MDAVVNQVAQMLNDTLSVACRRGENQGQRVAADTYLKNFTRRNVESDVSCSNISKEFKDQLLHALLQAEPAILKVSLEAVILVAEFVKQNSWPELVPELQSAIQNSNQNAVIRPFQVLNLFPCAIINNGANCGWNTVNVLMVLHAIIRPSQKLDFLQERIISLAFDVISHILETGPVISSTFVGLEISFTTLFVLDTAIFPALVLNETEEISGWREDLFTARKSAINLLGVISMSKFSIPCDANASDSRILKDAFCLCAIISFCYHVNHGSYFGVLMAYGGLQDFLREQKPEFTTNLVRSRVLPLYIVSACLPYLVASANWVLGELASCLSEDMSGEVYTALLKALAMLDMKDISFYPVRVSAAGAIHGLLDNDYLPPEWYPLLQVLVGRIGNEDEENSILFQLLSSVVGAANENVADHIPYIISSLVCTISKRIHPSLEPWPQVVERGFAALALMAQSWENSMPEEAERNDSSEKWTSGQATIAKALSALLQQAWLTPIHSLEGEVSSSESPPSCIDDASTLLRSIMLAVSESNVIVELKLSELLLVWADLIADWHAWEETEDLSIFDCIEEVVSLHSKYGLKNFIVRQMPSPPAPPVPLQSIIEGIGAFLSEAIVQYPSATWRACACVHTLLHVPNYSETEGVKQTLTIAFSRAAFSHFRRIQSKPCSLWKPLVLAISSCYLCYPDTVEGILKKEENGGFTIWGSALAYICSSSFEPGLSLETEIKLVVLTLTKVVERMLGLGNPGGSLLQDSYASLMEMSVRLKQLQEQTENDEEEEEEAEDEDDEESLDDDEDSEDDEHEETEAEFLERYARAALELESDSLVEEGDVEDQEREIELGSLEEIDPLKVMAVLLQRYHNVLTQGQALPSQVISNFSNAFPQYTLFFQ